jgi:cytoskeletal protein RodZ
MPSLGEEFRAAREARKLSLSDVSEQVHIRTVYLQSIEDENWSAISAPVYVRGFLRTYARFLGIDPERVVERYNGALAAAEPVQPVATAYRPEDFEQPRSSASPITWILGGIALLLIALVGYTYFASPHGAAGQAASGAATPAAVAGAPDAVVPGSLLPAPGGTSAVGPLANSLSVHALANSWVRVVIDGKAAFEGIAAAGSDRTFHGKLATVRVGNAGGVEVAVNGKNLGTLGPPGSVVERSFPLEQNGGR